MEFINLSKEKPLVLFKEIYQKALDLSQKNIEAMAISSYNNIKKEVDSRYVNLKYIHEDNFIFFTNYDSPKSIAFDSNNQIAAVFFWPCVNTQIRIKAHIQRTSTEYNNDYFQKRSLKKNALAISSMQSQKISSYSEVLTNYEYAQNNRNLTKCPKNWGGYTLKPYEIEFWVGHQSRLNKRDLYTRVRNGWEHSVLQP